MQNCRLITQLANIPARITLYELLRLSKLTKEALREALVDTEAFMARIPAKPEEEEEDDNHCHHTLKQFPCITITTENMQVKKNMTGPCITQSTLDHLK